MLIIIPQPNADGKFHKGKGGIVPGVWLLWCLCATDPRLGGEASDRQQLPRAATFCLKRTSSLDRDKGQWDKCQMASPVTPYRMPLIVAWRRPFTPTSGGKTAVSWLQGRRERCADAVSEIRPRAASSSGPKMETPPGRRFSKSREGTIKIQGAQGSGYPCLGLPVILAPLPLVTAAWFFFGKMPTTHSQSPWC